MCSHDVVIAVSMAKRGIYLFGLTLFIVKAMHNLVSTQIIYWPGNNLLTIKMTIWNN